MTTTVSLANYLFTRLRQLGIEAVHGVPGDYNLASLDYLEPAGLHWVGDANELNAGYAADGYARVKGIGAVMTTFGVGELSVINAIAGSYAEMVPVVHIAGSPSTKSQQAKTMLHHTFGNGDFKVFADIYQNVTVAQATLDDIRTATELVDSTLRECWIKSRPVYIELPANMVTMDVNGAALETPLDLSPPKNSIEKEEQTVDVILNRLYNAKQPVLLIDGFVSRYRLTSLVETLIRKSNLPAFVTPMGKSSVDETLPNFRGMYAGSGSSSNAVRQYVESSDLVLYIGPIKCDYNTTGFTSQLSTPNVIELHSDFTTVGYAQYDVHIHGLIQRLIPKLDPTQLFKCPSSTPLPSKTPETEPISTTYPPETITQDYLWPSLSTWLQPHDIVLTETGTSYHGIWSTTLPHGCILISQGLWGSIGFTLPAAQGAALAARELDNISNTENNTNSKRRVVLFEGDGSLQLTAQAIGTMLKERLDIVIVVLNNAGYTIERWVHGMGARYNDIPGWRYALLPEAMGGKEGDVRTWVVRTTDELEGFWGLEEVRKPVGMKFVEMFMPKEDAPISLKMVCAACAKTNKS